MFCRLARGSSKVRKMHESRTFKTNHPTHLLLRLRRTRSWYCLHRLPLSFVSTGDAAVADNARLPQARVSCVAQNLLHVIKWLRRRRRRGRYCSGNCNYRPRPSSSLTAPRTQTCPADYSFHGRRACTERAPAGLHSRDGHRLREER